MKIAAFHNLPSGGAKRALYGFVKQLRKLGHSVDAFLPSTADELYLPLKGVVGQYRVFPVQQTLSGWITSTFRYLPPVRISLVDLERTQERIAEAVDSGNYDAVLAEQDRFTLSPFVLKYLKKPSVYYCPQPYRGKDPIWQRYRDLEGSLFKRIWHNYFLAHALPRIDRHNAGFANRIVTNSNYSKEVILHAYGLGSFVCYPGIDTEVFQPNDLPKENMVLSVGSVNVTKGYDFLISAVARIENRIRPRLVIVGNAVDTLWKRHLEDLAVRQEVHLEVRSLVDDNDLVRIYNQARVFAFASYREPLGLAPLEALACGTPVVAIGEGGVPETVDSGQTGILTGRDELQFSDAIVQLLTNEHERKRMGEQGVAAVRSFWTLDHAAKRLLSHLESVTRD